MTRFVSDPRKHWESDEAYGELYEVFKRRIV